MTIRQRTDLPNGNFTEAVTIVDSNGVVAGSAPLIGTQSSVASAITDTVILATNTARKGALVYNDSTSILYILLSNSVSSTTAYSVQIPSQGLLTLKPTEYAGIIKGNWATANGFARVTEFA